MTVVVPCAGAVIPWYPAGSGPGSPWMLTSLIHKMARTVHTVVMLPKTWPLHHLYHSLLGSLTNMQIPGPVSGFVSHTVWLALSSVELRLTSCCWASFRNVSCSDTSEQVATHPSRHQSAGAAGHLAPLDSGVFKYSTASSCCLVGQFPLSTLPGVTLNTLFTSLFLGVLICENGVNTTTYLRVVGDRVHYEQCSK